MQRNIELPSELDNLKNSKSLIDLDDYSSGDFGFGDYVLTTLLDDILLVEYVDEVEDSSGSAIIRNGLYVPTNSLQKSWRKGKVILAGVSVKTCKVGDIVIFPNDKGVSVANVEVENYGILRKGMFLNEQRIFGICKISNEGKSTVSKESSIN